MPETNNEDHVAAKNDEQESGWDGRDQWDKLRGTTEKVELVRTYSQERVGERLLSVLQHFSGLQKVEEREGDQRPLEEELLGERERETRQGGKLECSQGSGAGTESVGLRRCRPHTPTGAGRPDDDDDE